MSYELKTLYPLTARCGVDGCSLYSSLFLSVCFMHPNDILPCISIGRTRWYNMIVTISKERTIPTPISNHWREREREKERGQLGPNAPGYVVVKTGALWVNYKMDKSSLL